jgi:nicotinate-nucleotide adenylyltransferase
VVTRAGVPQPELGPPWRTERVEIPALEVSSSELRARRAEGRPLDFLIPRPAIDCIRRRGLYA